MKTRLNVRWFRLHRSFLFLVVFTCVLFILYSDLTSRSGSTQSRISRMPLKLSTKAAADVKNITILGAIFNPMVLGNYEPKSRSKREGPGEYGVPLILEAAEKELGVKSIDEFGFNIYASDKISLDREIKDSRPNECKYWHYPEEKYLPTASVIVVFFNEGWSVIARTVHSVINTSPEALLKEVILIDDHSTYHMYENFTEYIKRWNGKVRIHRTSKREGLIKARVIGARMAKGDVIIVLDAHCECVVNWLPPLLTRIALNRKTLAIPIVDSLQWDTLEHVFVYKPGELFTGIWEWGFLYKETQTPKKELAKRKHESEPYWSPTHAGGLLAIEKNWFFELGGYDENIRVWGGEQYELSFKVWLCGGVVEWVPCSHVAHAYRGPKKVGYPFPGILSYQVERNHLRVAETWMDEFKEYYKIRIPPIEHLDYGDISEQLEIKSRLQCKPFKWFMDNVAYEMYSKYPLPPPNAEWGECRNVGQNVCLDQIGAVYGEKIGVRSCAQQLFRLNVAGELSSGEACFHTKDKLLMKKFCIDDGTWTPVGEWKYDNVTLQMISSVSKECLETDATNLFMSPCNSSNANQKWEWRKFYYS